MTEDFHAASDLLTAALERYHAACSILTGRDSNDSLDHVSLGVSNVIQSELGILASNEIKFKQAKAMINQTRNTILTIAPVNMLPPDILIQIFHMVRGAQLCLFADHKNLKAFPLRYPEILSHVCSRWRQIAIDSRGLWSHIDVPPCQGDLARRKLLARAKTFAARAAPSLLDIHITGQPTHHSPDIDIDPDLVAFCSSVATRLRSLELSLWHVFDRTYLSIFRTFLQNCVAGTLNRLVMEKDFGVITIAASGSESASQAKSVLDISHEHLEECLLPVRVLRWTGIYFCWTSLAYRGLVELRLIPKESYQMAPIKQLQLMKILIESPRLRVLYLGLGIIGPFAANAPPVSLGDLEVLDLRAMDCTQYGVLLRMLAPGSKLLHLSVSFGYHGCSLLFSDDFKRFFARSRVGGLYIHCSARPRLALLEFFSSLHMLNLRTLVLNNLELRMEYNHQPEPWGLILQSSTWPWGNEPKFPQINNLHLRGCPKFPPQIDDLHLIGCPVDLGQLRSLARAVPIQTLKLANCGFEQKFRYELVGLASTVTFLPTPLHRGNWDPWE